MSTLIGRRSPARRSNPASRTASPADDTITVTAAEAVFIRVHASSDEADLWEVARQPGHQSRLRARIKQVVGEELGPDFAVLVLFRKGSHVTEVFARLKRAVVAAGKKVVTVAKSTISRAVAKVKEVVVASFAGIRKVMTSEMTKKVAGAAFATLNGLSSLATIGGFFGFGT